MRALLIGAEPFCDLGFSYVDTAPYDAVVIGSLTLSQAVCFALEPVLEALAEGKSVVCYAPGFPSASAASTCSWEKAIACPRDSEPMTTAS